MFNAHSKPVFPLIKLSCSTFMIRNEGAFLIGHNLDMPMALPGMVVVNKRGVTKQSITHMELISGQEQPFDKVVWVSKFGSITFNPLGKEFADGGINEAGLYIQEMTLLETVYPDQKEMTPFQIELWIQYQLDNFQTVEEVLENISRFSPDGGDFFRWHFFLSDKDGDCALVEFLDGKPVIVKGENVLYPVLCNTIYQKELKNLKAYKGFGGSEVVNLTDLCIERFVHAAHLVKHAPYNASPVYAFDILSNLNRGGTQWSYVIDVKTNRVYFRTAANKKIKFFDLNAVDYGSETPVRLIDIDVDLEGDVAKHFLCYSSDLNRQFVLRGYKILDSGGHLSKALEKLGTSMPALIERWSAFGDQFLERS